MSPWKISAALCRGPGQLRPQLHTTPSDDVAVSYNLHHSFTATIEAYFLAYMSPRDIGVGNLADISALALLQWRTFFPERLDVL
uniref:Uncharacterized protein n=1 Tax=Bursaphelenchus xylophilus TaxID=6326 RepID=A0A1I7SP04_BURXY